MSNLVVTDKEFKGIVHKLCRDISLSEWRPDYVVGLTRGGLVAATWISHYFDVPMETVKPRAESNCWMAEDAFGYVSSDQRGSGNAETDPALRKNILLVDDINDTGGTLEWICQDWASSCLPHHTAWNAIWNRNVKFAVLVNNESSNFKTIDYSGITINKHEDPCWVVFPWESWWDN